MERKLQLIRKGFSLIELLVVMSIIGVLSTIGIISYSNYILKSKIAAVKSINERAVSYISAETIKCLIGGQILVMERSGPLSVKCNKNPYSQYSTGQIVGNIMGYIDHTNLLGNNPFNPEDQEGSFKIDQSSPLIIGRTNCFFFNNTIKCVSKLDSSNEYFTNEYEIQI